MEINLRKGILKVFKRSSSEQKLTLLILNWFWSDHIRYHNSNGCNSNVFPSLLLLKKGEIFEISKDF